MDATRRTSWPALQRSTSEDGSKRSILGSAPPMRSHSLTHEHHRHPHANGHRYDSKVVTTIQYPSFNGHYHQHHQYPPSSSSTTSSHHHYHQENEEGLRLPSSTTEHNIDTHESGPYHQPTRPVHYSVLRGNQKQLVPENPPSRKSSFSIGSLVSNTVSNPLKRISLDVDLEFPLPNIDSNGKSSDPSLRLAPIGSIAVSQTSSFSSSEVPIPPLPPFDHYLKRMKF